MKKLKFVLLLSLSLLFSEVLPAQENLITLNYQKLKLPANEFWVQNLIDARIDKSCIGYFFGGYYTNKVPIIIESGLSKSLQTLFKAGGLTQSTEKTTLTIKINKLFVYQLGGENDFFDVLEINLDFYVQESGKYYHEFTSGRYYTFNRFKRNENIDDMIVKAIEDSFTEFFHRMNNKWGYHQIADETGLYQNSLNQAIKSKTSTISHKNCIYYTFNGFRDNHADTLTNFVLKTKGKYDEVGYKKFKFEDDLMQKSGIWGVYYNNELYIQFADIFIPVKITPTDYILENLASLKENDNSRTTGGAGIGFLLLGPVGAAIGAGVGALAEKPNHDILNSKFKIDMTTGMPVPFVEQKKGNQ